MQKPRDPQTTTYVDGDAILEALYQALKDYHDGKFNGGCVGAGILQPPLSGIYLAVGKAVKGER